MFTGGGLLVARPVLLSGPRIAHSSGGIQHEKPWAMASGEASVGRATRRNTKDPGILGLGVGNGGDI